MCLEYPQFGYDVLSKLCYGGCKRGTELMWCSACFGRQAQEGADRQDASCYWKYSQACSSQQRWWCCMSACLFDVFITCFFMLGLGSVSLLSRKRPETGLFGCNWLGVTNTVHYKWLWSPKYGGGSESSNPCLWLGNAGRSVDDLSIWTWKSRYRTNNSFGNPINDTMVLFTA